MKDRLVVGWVVQREEERKAQEVHMCYQVLHRLKILSQTNNAFKDSLFTQLINIPTRNLLFTFYLNYMLPHCLTIKSQTHPSFLHFFQAFNYSLGRSQVIVASIYIYNKQAVKTKQNKTRIRAIHLKVICTYFWPYHFYLKETTLKKYISIQDCSLLHYL